VSVRDLVAVDAALDAQQREITFRILPAIQEQADDFYLSGQLSVDIA
jgi:hypothetical protein